MSSTSPEDCLACKLIGTAAFTGIGTYALYIQYDMMAEQLKALNDRPFSQRLAYSIRNGPRYLAVTSGVFYTLAALRLFTRPTATISYGKEDGEK